MAGALLFPLALLSLLASCVSVSVRTSVPPAPEYIMGQGKVSSEELARFLAESNPGADRSFTGRLAEYYVTEAAAEGVNHDVAFAQMCLETGFLRYGGLVTPDMNNFCGLGSTGPGHPGEIFPEPRIGVRAHIQHLKAYATAAPLNQKLVDPRYRWVRYGSSPGIQGLAGTWAADRAYGEKLETILERLYLSAFNSR
ncbi:MAG: glucosaminidase domain-containing protein [Treponema sp.]|nr:glucosaminidase domain-containing protein [Treponema sp.]